MIRKTVPVLALLVLTALAAWPVLAAGLDRFTLDAQVFDPQAECCGFSYQGAVRVDLFNATSGGTSLWGETHAGAAVDHGFLSLPLGRVNIDQPLADVLKANAGTPLFAQVKLSEINFTFPERVEITSVPYALVCSEAGRADTVKAAGTLAPLKELLGMQDTPDADFVRDLKNAITKDCPPGYDRQNDPSIIATGYYCRKSVGGGKYDEMVKVGSFWIDRYENSLWANADCTGAQKGLSDGDAHAFGFTRNGTDSTAQLYACSVKDAFPSRYITWFQAEQACVNVGKNLATNEEWQAAASGTPDPGSWPDANSADGCAGDASVQGTCNTCSGGPRPAWAWTGATACMSRFGAYDMVGNLWEWTLGWNLHGGAASPDGSQTATEFNGDGYWNVEKAEATGIYDGTGNKAVFPAAALRGGSWSDGAQAGVFALSLSSAPSYRGSSIGFRCARK